MYDHQANSEVLFAEINWLGKVIDQVICSYLMHEGHEKRWDEIPLPDLTQSPSPYATKVREWELGIHERLVLALTFAPHLKPELLDIFFGKNQIYDRGFTEFGGMVDPGFSGFLPTIQTFMFLISGTTPEYFHQGINIVGDDHILLKEGVLDVHTATEHIPPYGALLNIPSQWVHFFLTGKKVLPERSASFPAQPISTHLTWGDLVLEDHVMEQVEEIKGWINHGNTLLHEWGLNNKIKPGYRALFFGTPGTGKTLTASLLGKSTGREVFRVDLSMIVSKYIGETEKNLSKVFDAAAYKDWILFFDEADALFGKRTQATSSNDRHANQQTGYLLQRIEDFPGVVILATNLKSNMDEAFTRRFQAMIQFEVPPVEQRLTLWQNAFSGNCKLDESIDVWKVAEEYELAGGAIINILRFCALSAIKRGSNIVTPKELMEGLRREFKKDNRTISTVIY